MVAFVPSLLETGAILLTYLLAKEIYDEKRALLASLFLTISLYHAQNSSFVTPDVLSSFFLVLFLIVLRRAFLQPENTSLYTLAGVVLGLLVGTKYNGAIATIVICVLYLYTLINKPTTTKLWHLNLVVCGSVAILVFVITTPGIILHFSDFLESMNRVQLEVMRSNISRTISDKLGHRVL